MRKQIPVNVIITSLSSALGSALGYGIAGFTYITHHHRTIDNSMVNKDHLTRFCTIGAAFGSSIGAAAGSTYTDLKHELTEDIELQGNISIPDVI